MYAEEVAKQLSGLNKKQIDPIPAHLVKNVPEIHIFNVGPFTFVQQLGSLGTFTIQGCEEGEEYSKPCSIRGIVPEGIALEMNTIHNRMWDGHEVALDIIGKGQFKAPSQNLEAWGVFIAEGKTPTKKELSDAKEKMLEKCSQLVREADELFARGPQFMQDIDKNHRWAAKMLNIERDWCKAPASMLDCPGCGFKVNPHAAVHAGKDGCGAVLDEKRVIRMRLKGYEHLWEKKKDA